MLGQGSSCCKLRRSRRGSARWLTAPRSHASPTSGTSGKPKGVLHSDNALLANARQLAKDWHIDDTSVVFSLSPLSHNLGFGAQVMACARELGLNESKLNVNGGAIAIGHPLGATGVRLSLTLARELKRSGLRYGISSACIGGGQGIAMLIENPEATRN